MGWMARPRPLWVAGLVACAAWGGSPVAADEPAPPAPAVQPATPAPAPAGSEVWRVEREGVVMELPVGNLSEPVREVLRARMLQQGWKLVGPADAGPQKPPPAPVLPAWRNSAAQSAAAESPDLSPPACYLPSFGPPTGPFIGLSGFSIQLTIAMPGRTQSKPVNRK